MPDAATNGTSSAERIRARATAFLDDYAQGDQTQPFFLYLPFQNVHAPYECAEKFRALFENRTDLTSTEKTMFGPS